jgi:hypothetical protein
MGNQPSQSSQTLSTQPRAKSPFQPIPKPTPSRIIPKGSTSTAPGKIGILSVQEADEIIQQNRVRENPSARSTLRPTTPLPKPTTLSAPTTIRKEGAERSESESGSESDSEVDTDQLKRDLYSTQETSR